MNRQVLAVVLVVAAAVTASSAVWARQAVPAPNVPGMPTMARTMVINGAGEPVPVVLAAGGQVQPVTLVGVPSMLIAQESVVATRVNRQGWEYRSVAVAAGQDAADVLNGPGADGWEAVGVTAGQAGASQVLLKRPR